MKKLLAVVISILVFGTLFAGCSKKEESSSALEKIKKQGKLVVGLEDAYPPMEFRDSKNQLVGFDVDLSKEIAKKLGVDVDYFITDFNGIILALNSSKFDMILSGMSITDKRKETIDFSNPYVTGGQVIAIKKGNDSIKKLEDLKGKILGCQIGSIGDNVASGMKDLKEVKKYDKITEAFQEVSSGRVDAVIMDAQVGGYYMSEKSNEYEVLKEAVTEEPMGIGFRKGDKELQDAVNKALEELKADGTLSKLSQKWFGFDAYSK